MQDAINELSGILKMFKGAMRFSVASEDDIILFWIDPKDEQITRNVKEEYFISAIECLEWCEDNLEQT